MGHGAQLPLPEPPDTAAMVAEINQTRAAWYAQLEARWNTDMDYSANQYLLDREAMESWYNHEATRIDMVYRDFYGVR